MRPTLKYLLLSLAFGAAAAGCIGREVAEVTPNQARENLKPIPVSANRDIDLLFVVDNSISMGEEQNQLVRNFPQFINVLETIEGGLPNVRIGVVSTDVGTGGEAIGGCSPSDNGQLLTRGREFMDGQFEGCPDLRNNDFIEDVESATPGGDRVKNYDGTLADAFTCIAQLGTLGCGFEQPLEAAKRALDPNGPNAAQVANFIRPNAFLAVIFITDEDDCSARGDTLFSEPSATENDPLGPLSSFRCFEFGVTCEQAPRVRGQKSGCVPNNESEFLVPVSEYIEFFRSLKPDPQDVIVAGIIGNTEPVVVQDNSRTGDPDLAPSCVVAGDEGADPAIRIASFLEGFPQRNTVQTICEADLTNALVQIAELLRLVVGNPCLEGNIKTDPIECQVSDIENYNSPDAVETTLPVCNNTDSPTDSTNQPCFVVFEDRAACSDTESGLTIQVYPVNRTVEGDVTTVVRCVAE